IDLNSGWLDEKGGEAALIGNFDPSDNRVVFHRVLDLSELNGRELCFISHDIVFSVYAGDTLIYDYHPKLGGYYGSHYGNSIHTVALPTELQEETLRIEGTVLYNNSWTGFEKVMLYDPHEYISSILKNNFLIFIICLLIFGFGVILFLFGLVENILHGDMMTETICLGVITMLLSLWTNTHTMILHIITENSAALRIIDYVVLCLLPIPTLVFVGAFTKSEKNKLLHINILLCIVNFIGQLAGVSLGLFDYTDALKASHLLILLGMVLSAFIITKAIKSKKVERSQYIYLISALAIIIGAGLIDMIRYYIGHYPDSSHITRIGLILFVGILTIYEFRQLITVKFKSREAEVMQDLAMKDPLTGLKSRTAFVRYEKDLKTRNEGERLFIHFDVNFLKTVNDTYGHAEGDRHIIAAANVIKECFGEYGQCFRVGGDEFFAVLECIELHKRYDEGIIKFHELQEEYNKKENPPIPLAIAHGTAEYNCMDHDPEEAENLADSRMYENKKQMKSGERA
ncbi:MAG: diguanylate cyclase, partial [Ruminiclostridium sp.]|nr:diguanylate cyclase [Ruminiclostridium sp.]